MWDRRPGYDAAMSQAPFDEDRELSPYDESGDAEAPADDLNREEEQAAELREDGERPVFGDPMTPEEAAYSLEEPSEDVE